MVKNITKIKNVVNIKVYLIDINRRKIYIAESTNNSLKTVAISKIILTASLVCTNIF